MDKTVCGTHLKQVYISNFNIVVEPNEYIKSDSYLFTKIPSVLPSISLNKTSLVCLLSIHFLFTKI